MPGWLTVVPTWLGLGLAVLLSGCAAYFTQESTLAHAYLEQARQAAAAHDAAKTLAALDQAEAASVTTRSGRPGINYSPQTLRGIGEARQSVGQQRWGDAVYYIDTALIDPTTILPR